MSQWTQDETVVHPLKIQRQLGPEGDPLQVPILKGRALNMNGAKTRVHRALLTFAL